MFTLFPSVGILNDIPIGSILEMPAISRSSTVYITLNLNDDDDDSDEVTKLPVETISNWLNRERHVMDQNQRDRNLVLNCEVQYAQIQEICDFLKQVSYYPQLIFINVFNTKEFI